MLLIGTLAYAQPNEGGQPISRDPRYQALFANQNLPEVKTPRLDLERIRKEDEQSPAMRFAAPTAVNFSPQEQGQWTELENGDRVWRLQIRSEGALAVAFFYENLYLPKGARLFMYSPDGAQISGAYTFRNNTASKRFWTGLIYGEVAVVEYYEPLAVKGQGSFRIFRVDHAYDAERLADRDGSRMMMTGFGTALACHENIECPLGDDWQDEERGVCRIILVVEEGMGFCTGTVLNNTERDGKPLMLTAFHCMDGYTPLYDLWRFDFKYQGPLCANPLIEPAFQSLLGSTFRAGRQQNDFLLVELIPAIPPDYNVRFNGWSRANTAPAMSTIIHHPKGDIKKIARSTTQAAIHTFQIQWNNDVNTPPNHHFRVNYTTGTFEVGSSGAGLFNQQHLVVAQLHGGNPSCATTTGFFGRLSLSWNGGDTDATRLKTWLDPSGTMVGDTLHGMENPATGGLGTIEGFVGTEEDAAIAGAIVTLQGADTTLMDTTDASGFYSFEDLPSGGTYSIDIHKNTNITNGVSTVDIIRIRRQLLVIENLQGPYKLFAADVNASGGVSVTDIVFLSRVILGIQPNFPNVESWQFFPADFTFNDPQNPLSESIPRPYVIENLAAGETTEVSFIGIKSGDVDGNANPQN